MKTQKSNTSILTHRFPVVDSFPILDLTDYKLYNMFKLDNSTPGNKVAPAFAFPLVFDVPHPTLAGQVQRQIIMGMAMRDYFAAKAMQAFLTVSEGSEFPSDFSSIASDSYRLADAMCKEMQKPVIDGK